MFAKLFGIVFLILLVVGAVCFFNGWIEFRSGETTTTIEMKTGEMESAAERTIDKGKELMDKAGQKINELSGNRGSEKQ